MEVKDVYISNGTRPLWQLLIAAVLYTASLYFVYLFVTGYQANIDKNFKGLATLLEVAIFCFAGGIGFSRVVDYQFDLKEKKYRIIYNFGIVRLGRSYLFVSIDYISVYFNKSKGLYEVKLWYNTNKHFTLVVYEEYVNALDAGVAIANKLELDLWDASDPHNGKWAQLE
ncbi:hypothetical protein SCB49_07477 [unidentified eubacterium SCB49]|nr:hypothetical protein SCB49_07477 [unidentified eubacterium SCB49]